MRLHYKQNSANAICDVCGFKFKLNQLRKRWDGLWVCSDDWEMRHPMDFIRAKKETQDLPITRPRPNDVFVPVPILGEDTCIIDDAIIDICIVDNTLGYDIIVNRDMLKNDGTAQPDYAIIDLAIVDRTHVFVHTADEGS